MLELEHEVITEDQVGLLSIPGGLWAALWACPPKAHEVVMYPLQFLTGNVPLATILGMPATTLQPATAGRKTDVNSLPTYSVRDASTPKQNQMVALLI